jgi:hypothetical protein
VAGGVCPLCRLEESVIPIRLKCSETQSWRETFLERKWLSLNGLVLALLDLCSFKLLNFRRTNLFF